LIRPKLLTATGDPDIYIGEREYISGPGTYSFKVPLSVTRIHACCIGGGAQGAAQSNSYQEDWDGGGGGGLGWANNIEVEPGEELTIQVGGTVGINGANANDGDSFIKRGDDILVAGHAPGNTYGNFINGGTFVGDGGGEGGRGAGNSTWTGENGTRYVKNKGSGGGAGGYTGNGGNGSIYGGENAGTGGAGSGGVSRNNDWNGNFTQSAVGSRGGGTGILGAGASGAAPRPSAVEFWSSAPQQPGFPGSGGDKMEFGAGGAGEKDGWDGSDNTQAGHGAVRIIWGNQFSYPNNADVK
jgi:hypothetical protein